MEFPMAMIRQIIYGSGGGGVAMQDLLKGLPLSEAELADSGLRLSWQEGIKVWEAALAASGDEAFGLHAGQQVTTSMAGLVGHIMERSKNLYEASMALQQYLPLANEMFDYRSWLEERFLVVSIRPVSLWTISSPETARHAVDMSFASILHIIRLLTGRSIVPERVEFAAAPPRNIKDYHTVFQTALHFSRQDNRMVFRKSAAFMPIIGYNQEILDHLRELATERMLGLDQASSTRQAVEKWVSAGKYSGLPSLAEAAAELHMSMRSLQRKLQAEGTSFRKVVDNTYEQLAVALLQNTGLSVDEVSARLGYADAHAFRKAFRRWTGKNPYAFRKA